MKKLTKKDYTYLGVFLIFILLFITILYCKGFLFGSNTDWLNQYITIPEYFRSLFYEKGTIIPEFALNLGLGQNIYYFSYYGLLSPLILLSYLLPFIPMSTYIILISIISLIASIYLFYRFINNKYSSNIAFYSTIVFLLNSTFFYHFHRHIMFVNYMPFLLLALIGVDKYFENKKPFLLIISCFLMIMTSYYFSVSGIITIGIYSIYHLLKKKTKKKQFIKTLSKIIMYVSIGILMAGIILIPTIYALIKGRASTSNETLNILSLLLPNYDHTFYYSYYSWGITMIYIISIISAIISKKKENIFLGIISLLYIFVPIFSYLLNGFMYIDGKCFIPFLPLIIMLISSFLNNLLKNKINLPKIIKIFIPVSLLITITAFKSKTITLLLIDIILMLITMLILTKKSIPKLIIIPTTIVLLINFNYAQKNEGYVTKDTISKINDVYTNLNITDDNLYRTSIEENEIATVNKVSNTSILKSSIYSSYSNKNYLNFVRNIFQNNILNRDNTTITETNNILYNTYIGAKYLVTSGNAPIGYQKISEQNNISLYQNDNTLPIGYASNKIMSKREFDTLTYPETIDALLNYIIVDKSLDNVYEKGNVTKYTSNYKINEINNITYSYENNHYLIDAKEDNLLNISLSKPLKNEILIIKFNMNKQKEGYACSSSIEINGITNALSCQDWKYHNNNTTFEYVLSSNEEIKELNIKFSPGEFDIDNIELSKINYNTIKKIKNNVDEIIFKEPTTNNTLEGSVIVNNDGYVKLTIPYEKKGFAIYVDDVKTSYQKVDNAFIGFNITEGSHTIKIVYHTPYLKLGAIISFMGLFFLSLTIMYRKHPKKFNHFFQKVYKFMQKSTKKASKTTLKFIKNNKYYIFLFISLFILDLSLRLFYNSQVGYYKWYNIMPNLFSALWIIFILLLTKLSKNKLGKAIYLISYLFSLIMFLVHAIYFSYFNMFFDYSTLTFATEGAEYYSTVIANIKLWIVIVTILSIFLTIKSLKKIKHNPQTNYKRIIIIIFGFIIIKSLLPYLYGAKNNEVEWDDWRNARIIYENFNDNNKSMMVSGMFEYNIRNFKVNFLKDNEELTDAEKEVLTDNFQEENLNTPNDYTGIFKGKNLILIQLESIDSFLLDKKIMPTFYNLSKNSINFTNHYSFTSGGGSTFNSEFMVNTGYSSAYNYNQSAYIFSRNTYTYSLANLFKKEGYTVNAFHMNSKEYYSRGVNYKAFGYDSYNGLKDLNIYENNEYWLDTELINNDTFANLIFNNDKPSVSYIITYSAHLPYKTSKGTCGMLTDEEGLTELDCLKTQAKETDDMIKLLIEKLKEKDMLENTVIALFSDHYVYTLENKEILETYKETDNNLINKTPFMIYNNGNVIKTIKEVNSQLDILPTLLNLFGIEYNVNNYIGRDILDKNYDPIVFFSDGSWYNGSTYVANGEYQSGKKISTQKLEKYNLIVKRKMLLNDAVIKSDYFKSAAKS